MASLFAWLDYSEHDRRRMQDTIQLFSEKTTRDELGIGVVRDVFADLLFPGTSTIQTRAKYFLFIPWIYLTLERRRVSSNDIALRARRVETDLINSLALSDDSWGTIGRRARENVQRLPSSVYWQGLLTWGIRTFEGSQEEYHVQFGKFHLRLARHSERKSEVDEEAMGSPPGNWHACLPPIPGDFPKNQDFALNEIEATYLKERILERCPDSLLAELLRHPRPIEEVQAPWELKEMPEKIRHWLEQARMFALLMQGAPLLYNLLLSEKSQIDDLQEEYRDWLGEWWRDLPADSSTWRLEPFWEIVYRNNPRTPRRTQQFVENWIRSVRSAGSIEKLMDDPYARKLVEEREFQLKGKLSRFTNDRIREIWAAGGGAAGTGMIDYRWGPAKKLLIDIYQGLGVTY